MRFSRFYLFISLIIFSMGASEISCTNGGTSTDKRIQKQKKRQKRKPGDCPRIDCRSEFSNPDTVKIL